MTGRVKNKTTLKEFLEDEQKHREVFEKACILGAFDQSVNYVMAIIRKMDKLDDDELKNIKALLIKYFEPRI